MAAINSAGMMTSSNGNIFRVTGHLCGEFTGPGEFPAQRPVTQSFDVFFDLCLNKRLNKQPWGWWFLTPSWSLWRHCNVKSCLGRGTESWGLDNSSWCPWVWFRYCTQLKYVGIHFRLVYISVLIISIDMCDGPCKKTRQNKAHTKFMENIGLNYHWKLFSGNPYGQVQGKKSHCMMMMMMMMMMNAEGHSGTMSVVGIIARYRINWAVSSYEIYQHCLKINTA